MVVESSTCYFEEPGRGNTEALLDLAKKRALEKGVTHVVVASTSGETGVKAAEAFQGTGVKVVVVTHQAGMRQPGVQELTEENRKRLGAMGATVVTCTHAFSGVGVGLSRVPPRPGPPGGQPAPPPRMPPSTPPPGAVVAQVLRLFCAGVKVCVEIALMAADAGAIPVDRDVVAIGGTGRGADTAMLLRPAHTNSILDLDLHEIIAKPFSGKRRRREAA